MKTIPIVRGEKPATERQASPSLAPAVVHAVVQRTVPWWINVWETSIQASEASP